MSLYRQLVARVFYPLSLWRRGELATLRWLAEFERTQFLSTDELHQLQQSRLRSILTHAAASCPYYRERFREIGFAPGDFRDLGDLAKLPILEKRDIQHNGQRMIAEGWPQADLIRNQTGGSTGTPISFYLSLDRKCSRAAATLRHDSWAGRRPGDSVAVIWGAPLDRPERTLRGKLYQLLLREPTWLDCGALTEERMAHFHAELWRQRPKIVQAYARSAVLFARWLEANRLQPHRPESIITSAEVLEDEDRALLERVFGSRVYNRYGCREFSVVASECSHGGMHVMAESLYVEVENGALLVTDLLNEAMPMIRYRIGDMGEWATGECACGRKLPRLKKIAGRVTDFLVGSDGRMVSGVFLATYVVAHRPSLGQVQIVQDRAGHVLYRLCPGPRFDSICDAEYLRQATQQHLGNAATMEMEIVNEIPRAASGKFVFSRSSVVPNYVRAG